MSGIPTPNAPGRAARRWRRANAAAMTTFVATLATTASGASGSGYGHPSHGPLHGAGDPGRRHDVHRGFSSRSGEHRSRRP
jgi:hypothetical protein